LSVVLKGAPRHFSHHDVIVSQHDGSNLIDLFGLEPGH
jgi:hypothetical protein